MKFAVGLQVVVSGGPKTENVFLGRSEKKLFDVDERGELSPTCLLSKKPFFGRETDVQGGKSTDGVVWGLIFEKRGL